MKILIAEDDFTTRTILAEVLTKQGHEVVATVNGAEAWAAMQQPDAPRLAILDWMMPEMNGIEVCRRVCTLETDNPPYIIMLTAKGEKADIIAGLEAGANDYLAKPFNLGELHARVNVGRRMVELQAAMADKVRQLRESEEQYRSLYEGSRDGFCRTDMEGRLLEFNTSYQEMLGYTTEELLGRSYKEITPANWIAAEERIVKEQIIGRGYSDVYEKEYIRKDGTVFPIEHRSYLIKKDGSNVGMWGVTRDITKRKLAEDALVKAQGRYSTILQTVMDGFWMADIQGRLVEVNAAYCRMSGYSEKELLAKSIPDLEAVETYDNTAVHIRKIMAQGEDSFETRHRRKDGSIFDVEASVQYRAIEGGRFIAFIHDITSRKLAEKTLKESEEEYRNIFENVIEGIFQTTPEGRFRIVNPVLARIYGYSSPEEMIETVTDIGRQIYVNPDERFEFLRILHKKGSITDFEVQLKRKDGNVFWASINARCVYDENGNILYHDGTSEDITSRKQAEEELKHTLEKLRKSLIGTIQALSSTVETRDPYTAGHQRKVSNLARIIAQEMGLSSDTVDTIRMAGIIHDIGKISVPAEILSKPGVLTNTEMSLIEVHSQTGYNILKDVGLPYPIAEIVLQHHERLDGSGYPQALKGDQILLETRIISVADVVEAISSHRPYRPGFGIDVALEEIEKNKGILYDEKVVEVCVKLFREKGFAFE